MNIEYNYKYMSTIKYSYMSMHIEYQVYEYNKDTLI